MARISGAFTAAARVRVRFPVRKAGFFCHLSSLPQIFLNTGSLVCQEAHMHRTLGDQLSSCGSLSLDGLGIGDITPALVT